MIICPLTKSPQDDGGRHGALEKQDWHVACRVTRRLARRRDAQVLVVSDVHIDGHEHEADIYERTLLGLGVKSEKLLVFHKEYETIGQVYFALGQAREKNTELVFVVSIVHFPRVWWLSRHAEKVSYVITGGKPRPREFVTDFALAIIFPLIDVCGLRRWFQAKVQDRRMGGRH
jgi:hypothetical protein